MLKNMALITALLTVSVCIHAETLESVDSGTLTMWGSLGPIIRTIDTIADPTINAGPNLWTINVGTLVINPGNDLTDNNANSGSTGNLALQPGGTLTLSGTGSLNVDTTWYGIVPTLDVGPISSGITVGALVINPGDDLTDNNANSGSTGNLALQPGGTLTLSGTGGLIGSSFPTVPLQGALIINGDACLNLNNISQGNNNVTINVRGGTLSLGQIDDGTRFELGNITQTGGLIVSDEGFKLEHGQLNLSGGTLRTHTNAADLYIAGSTVSGGSLTNPINFTAGSTGMLQVENGTADFFDAFITGGLIQIDNTIQTDTSKFLIVEVNDGGKTYQQLTLTPEPATMSLLAIGGLVVFRRRRRQS
jgi:hypothetical protein